MLIIIHISPTVRIHGESTNSFSLGEALQPASTGVVDMRMELPEQEAGWGVGVERVDRGAGGIMRLVAFLSDVYLSEWQQMPESRKSC